MGIKQKLFDGFSGSASFQRLSKLLQAERCAHAKNVAGSMRSLAIVALYERLSAPIMYVTPDSRDAESRREDVGLWYKPSRVALFPASEFRKTELQSLGTNVKGMRLGTLEMLAGQQQHGIVIAHHSALEVSLPPVSNFKKRRLAISTGTEQNFEALVSRLIDFGFVREARVENPGEISVRGGIVDIYPFSATLPIRIEFWGDDVESIRRFEPSTQRSQNQIAKVQVFEQQIDSPGHNGDNRVSVLDYLPAETVLILDEPERIRRYFEGKSCGGAEDEFLKSSPEDDDPKESEWLQLLEKMAGFRQVYLNAVGTFAENQVDFAGKEQPVFKGNLKLFRKMLSNVLSERDRSQKPPTIYYTCENEVQAARLEEIFADEEISHPELHVVSLGLSQGFSFPDGGLVVFTDHQFYGRSKRLRLPGKTHRGLTPRQLKRLNVGDYVVHVDFGIGIFKGLKKIKVQNTERECLQLEYKGRDKVYVRVERMDRVYKYAAKESTPPSLNKLGSPEWQKLKSRTKKKLKDMAKDLIQIYAKRKSQKGYSFSADNLWQRELEASFPYDDTPDQVKATIAVKEDMESPRPMDRLVCGDVGFGKTEIGVRAAFKAVMDHKQVAMLVPTTILAHQHYHTFKERVEPFPINVEMLSRFRTQAEQKRIVERIATGEIDIIIGTHRLLSKDVKFKSLGLIIIDEEQRFGVRHKEHLKKFRATIDVLTLTATPIPRTLQFALMGARDLTNIDTPPRNRLPIVTEVLSFNKDYIREIILKELARGGQVFFVHNRVRSIERVARMISDLLPEAKITVAHGQMKEKELEKVIIEFMQRKYDILVCTMIIESGMDMPNVNTIIINRADKLGLAQLYQLRGRVGRSHHRAFACLLIPPVELLTDDALKRLHAIEEFNELGVGTLLAMRDLEIRGAGNLLGAEQTGFINALGFDLYNKVLEEAVKELQEEALPEQKSIPKLEVQVEMDFDAFLPDNYVESGYERVDIYQRLTEAASLEELRDLSEELQDRFGPTPPPVGNLFNFIAIRLLSARLLIKRVLISEVEVRAEFSKDFLNIQGEPFKKWLGSIVKNNSQPIEFFQNKGLGIRVVLPKENNDKLLLIKNFMENIINSCGPPEIEKIEKKETKHGEGIEK